MCSSNGRQEKLKFKIVFSIIYFPGVGRSIHDFIIAPPSGSVNSFTSFWEKTFQNFPKSRNKIRIQIQIRNRVGGFKSLKRASKGFKRLQVCENKAQFRTLTVQKGGNLQDGA